MVPDDGDKCALSHKNSSSEGYLNLKNSYGGIPTNLVTNLIAVLILVILFILLRKSAWKVVNKIVKKDEVERWTHFFFSFTANIGGSILKKERTEPDGSETVYRLDEEDQIDSEGDDFSDEIRIERSDHDEDVIEESEGQENIAEQRPKRTSRQESDLERAQRVSRTYSINDETSFVRWLASTFTLGDEDIYDRCGNDALQYLRFQRHVIVYLIIITVLSISVILPVNFQGDLQGNATSFEHTTLVNLEPDSNMLWIHIIMAFSFFPLAILIMRRFSIDLHFQDEAKISLDYCKRNENLGRPPFTLYPVSCSRCCSCFCCCCVGKRDANEFYSEHLERLGKEFESEKEVSLKSPLGIVFVTFKSVNMAKDVYDSFKRTVFQLGFQPLSSSVSSIVKPEQWKVSFAPPPDDLYWENLSMSRRYLSLKKVFVNMALFFVTFFLTTPEYLVSQTNNIVPLIANGLQLPSWIVDFLPTILLWSFTALLPLLVAYSDRWLGHWTRSTENHSIMKKTFWYLLFMVILLPTLGFTTASASLQILFGNNTNETYRWECIFLPDSGAFFVNYVITAAMAGAGLELIRFPDLFWYTLCLCWSKSKAETSAIQVAIRYEFRFGEQYARMMLLFCMTVMFSVSCPLITPFGTLYFITKHYVDRQNLLYVYKPSKINKRMHATAISFVVLSTVVLQFFMMVFSVLRNGTLTDLSLRSKFAIGLFLLSVNVFSAQLWSDTCKKFSAIEYVECTYIREDQAGQGSGGAAIYLPDILKDEAERERERQSRKRASEMPRSDGDPPLDQGNLSDLTASHLQV